MALIGFILPDKSVACGGVVFLVFTILLVVWVLR